jgi:ABC-type branched-subunit amino acid transport system substrate-binding protein
LLKDKVDVALLLPLTGSNAAIGADMLDAAQQALLELGGPNLAITPKDTGSTADGAAAAANEAVADGAKLIVGPLTAPEIDAVRPIAQTAALNVIAFSNVAAAAGGGVYLIGFLPSQEIDRVVGYAYSGGVTHFAVIAPSNPYGQLSTGAIQAAASKYGASVDDTEVFSPDESDLETVVQHLAANGAPTFNAILLPEGGQQLRDVAQQLAGQKLTAPQFRLLGTGLWDTPGLGAEPNLVGGWYAAPPAEARTGFEQRFASVYGHSPQRMASLAYDAVGVAAVLARSGGDFSTASLTNPSGFAGTNGIFRFLPDGTNERGLAVLEVEGAGTSVVSPAPQSFAPPPTQ